MTTQTQLSPAEYETFFDKAISYETYCQNFQDEMAQEEQGPYGKYLPQNWSRQSRLDRKLKLTDQLLNTIGKIVKPLNWLVITEHWCGDASQIVPIINKVAVESNGLINLRFLYRDQNEELMNAHLTDGRSKSIPMLLSLDEDFNLLKIYGPRPAEAQSLVKSLLRSDQAYDIPLHTWYAKDKQQSIQHDLIDVLVT